MKTDLSERHIHIHSTILFYWPCLSTVLLKYYSHYTEYGLLTGDAPHVMSMQSSLNREVRGELLRLAESVVEGTDAAELKYMKRVLHSTGTGSTKASVPSRCPYSTAETNLSAQSRSSAHRRTRPAPAGVLRKPARRGTCRYFEQTRRHLPPAYYRLSGTQKLKPYSPRSRNAVLEVEGNRPAGF
jgi:hypothetical protein